MFQKENLIKVNFVISYLYIQNYMDWIYMDN